MYSTSGLKVFFLVVMSERRHCCQDGVAVGLDVKLKNNNTMGIIATICVIIVVMKYGGDVLAAILEFIGALIEILKPMAGWIIIGIGVATLLAHLC